MIEIKNLKKLWEDDGSSVLEGINLTIEDGDIYALVGRSGAGKSTLLRCINGLTSYQEGSLKVDGCEIKDLKDKELREFRRHVGMIFQQFSLLERETVYKNVALPMQCWKYPKDQIDKKVKELLELVGLGDKMNAKPRNLSGGQKQRVAVARALTMDPKILLCDEATSALDPKTTNSILDLLMEINQKLGITVIIVTHQMEVVRKACNKACILENGKIADEGSVKEIFIKQPQSLRRLLGEEEEKLPDTGHNIQISYLVKDMKDGELFSTMTSELQYVFPIVNGLIQDYQGDQMGIFVINIDDEHLGVVTDYLNQNGIKWRELSGEQGETEVNE
ncbi:methionine ABC transporter ATP-binding protein [Dorea formicigenerans]|uniref:Methionine ABC transporter ATP-binding protein n=1 Tax=Dorea formicigenerans TaxID=39486 RepID=A0A413W425_9FIRM|nr:methionine ABC transporter ATP-binding protein [Dorea formicigenerans]RHB40650.1 methionine ABC transporter ATP-binding protein [Dorea formicigenerans]